MRRNVVVVTALLEGGGGSKAMDITRVEDLEAARERNALVVMEECYSEPHKRNALKTMQNVCSHSHLFLRDNCDSEETILVFCDVDGEAFFQALVLETAEAAIGRGQDTVLLNGQSAADFSKQSSPFPQQVLLECRSTGKIQFKLLPLTNASQALVVFSLNNKRADLVQVKLLPKREFYFNAQDDAKTSTRVVVRQEWKLDGRGGTELGFGSAVYPAAVALSEYISRRPRHEFDGKRVLELGTGTGLCALVVSKLFSPEFVLATDGDESSVRLAQRNFSLNAIPNERFACEKLMWGETLPAKHAFQVVLACDIVAVPYREYFPALLQTLVELKRLAHGEFQVLLGYTPRHACEQAFFRELREEHGFSIERLMDLHADFAEEGDKIQLFRLL